MKTVVTVSSKSTPFFATFSAVTPIWPVPNGQLNAPSIMSIAPVSPIFWPQRAAGRM